MCSAMPNITPKLSTLFKALNNVFYFVLSNVSLLKFRESDDDGDLDEKFRQEAP